MEIKYNNQIWQFRDELAVGDFVTCGIPPASLLGLSKMKKNVSEEDSLPLLLETLKPIFEYILGLFEVTKIKKDLNVREIPTAALINFVLQDREKLTDWIMKGLLGLNL